LSPAALAVAPSDVSPVAPIVAFAVAHLI